GSRHVITNRRRFGKTTAPSCPPAAAKARLRSKTGSMLVVVIAVLRLVGVTDLAGVRCSGGLGARRLRGGRHARPALLPPDPVVQSPQRPRCPPVPGAEELHQRGDEQGANDGGVDQYG